MIGAIEAYVLGHYDIELDDLIKMKDATNRAFNSGHRVSNDPTIEEVRAKTVLLNEFDSPDRGYGPGLGGFVPGGFAAEEFEDLGDLIEKHPIGRTYTTGG